MNILIVDDEERNVKLLEAMLAQENYGLLTAPTGEAALKTLSEQDVDMVLLDIMMPGISGLEVLEKIRADERLKTLPVILITALANREHRIKGIKMGADDYVSKPFDREELVTRVNTQAKLSYVRRQLVEKEKLAKIVGVIEEGVIVADGNFIVVSANEKASGLLEFVPGNAPRDIAAYIKEKFSQEIARSGEVRKYVLERPETEKYNPLYLAAAVYPIKAPSGEIGSYVIVLRNVTSEYLENRLKSDFLGLISHKLRTPLATIGGMFYIINTMIDDAKTKEYLKKAENKLHEIGELMNKLLGFVEIESQNLNESFPTDTLDKIFANLQERYKKKCVINRDFSVETVYFWQRIIINELMDNAFKFHASKEEELKINLVLKDRYIEVSDNGPGIPPEEKEKIFEPFYQLEKYFTGTVPGVGLGLTLVRKIARLYNGKVEIESGVGRGTIVKVIFG